MLDAARIAPAVRRFREALSLLAGLPPRRKALLAGAGGLALLTAVLLARSASVSDPVGEVRVLRGPLRITVAVSGLLAPARAESYGPEIAGVEMKVAELAPEGTWVVPGALLVRFDDAPFQRELEVARSRLVQTSGEAEQARQALRALLASQRSERLEAEGAFTRAEIDLKTFVNGLAPLQVQQSAAAVERARRESEEARQKLEGLAPFAEKGYVSRDELRAAERRATEAEADLVLAGQQAALGQRLRQAFHVDRQTAHVGAVIGQDKEDLHTNSSGLAFTHSTRRAMPSRTLTCGSQPNSRRALLTSATKTG